MMLSAFIKRIFHFRNHLLLYIERATPITLLHLLSCGQGVWSLLPDVVNIVMVINEITRHLNF